MKQRALFNLIIDKIAKVVYKSRLEEAYGRVWQMD